MGSKLSLTSFPPAAAAFAPTAAAAAAATPVVDIPNDTLVVNTDTARHGSYQERLFFEFSSAPNALETPGGRQASDTPEAREWEDLFERSWSEVAAYTNAATPLEAATRAVLAGISVQIIKLYHSPFSLATETGLKLSDACIYMFVSRWNDDDRNDSECRRRRRREAAEGGGAATAMTATSPPPPPLPPWPLSSSAVVVRPPLQQQQQLQAAPRPETAAAVHHPPPPTAWHFPPPNAISFLRPHALGHPQDSCKYVAIRSNGAAATVAIEMIYHSAVSFVISIIFLSNLVDEGRDMLSEYDGNTANIPLVTEISVVATIYTGSAQMSEYHACHYLSLPWAVRFASAPLLVLSIFLNNVTNMLAFWELRDRWFFYGYATFVGLLVSIGLFYAVVMFLRATFAHRPPHIQWCRWFPYGKRYMANEMGHVLEAAGMNRHRQLLESWKAAVACSTADKIIKEDYAAAFARDAAADGGETPTPPPAAAAPPPPPPARPHTPSLIPQTTSFVLGSSTIRPPPPCLLPRASSSTQRNTIQTCAKEDRKSFSHDVGLSGLCGNAAAVASIPSVEHDVDSSASVPPPPHHHAHHRHLQRSPTPALRGGGVAAAAAGGAAGGDSLPPPPHLSKRSNSSISYQQQLPPASLPQ